MQSRPATKSARYDRMGYFSKIWLYYNYMKYKIDNYVIQLDEDDAVKFIGRNISPSGNGYFRVRKVSSRKYRLLHREIMNPAKDMYVDHINGDKADCRKINLRICTLSENACNARSDSKTGVRGVYWQQSRDRYQVQITKDGITYYLGRFINLDDAINARMIAEDKYHGDFAYKKRVDILNERKKPK